MHIIDNNNPKNSLYYVGAKALKIIRKNNGLTINEIYEEMRINRKITIQIVAHSLNWLFLLGVIVATKEGVIYYVSKTS